MNPLIKLNTFVILVHMSVLCCSCTLCNIKINQMLITYNKIVLIKKLHLDNVFSHYKEQG